MTATTAPRTWTGPSAPERLAILRRTKSIAIVGASTNPSRASYFVSTYLLSSSDYRVHFVNPRATEILGQPVYASLADHGLWFDTWPLVQHLPFRDRPLHMTYGDDSEFTRNELQQFIDVYDEFGTKLDWERGDVAVICNYRFAHGRPGIVLGEGETRKLGVLLGEQFERVGQRNDKW